MSDADKAAYIDAQVQAKTESANAAITAAEKTITDNQKLFDEFFEKNPDGRYFYATTKGKQKRQRPSVRKSSKRQRLR